MSEETQAPEAPIIVLDQTFTPQALPAIDPTPSAPPTEPAPASVVRFPRTIAELEEAIAALPAEDLAFLYQACPYAQELINYRWAKA